VAADKVAAVVVVVVSPAVAVGFVNLVGGGGGQGGGGQVAAVVDAPPAAADKGGAAGANPVVGVHPARWRRDGRRRWAGGRPPEVAAAEPVNSSQSSGASRICGAPFFVDAFFRAPFSGRCRGSSASRKYCGRHSRSLDDETDIPPENPPARQRDRPARNGKARNIARCVTSILSTTYANLELIVRRRQFHRWNGADRARGALHDPRARIVTSPPLPEGWFGKQWGCATARRIRWAASCSSPMLTQSTARDLVTRSMKRMRRNRPSFFPLPDVRELGGFWEKGDSAADFSRFSRCATGGTES